MPAHRAAEQTPESLTRAARLPDMTYPHVFTGNPLDRADALRRDPEQIAAAEQNPDGVYLTFLNLEVALADTEPPALQWLSRSTVSELLETAPPPVLLGLDQGRPHFALDVSDCDPQRLGSLGVRFENARKAAMLLPGADTGILAQARSQLDWHRRHRFCSVCGAATRPDRGGYLRGCPECGSEHFPRTDPVAIMLIVDGDECLLGQSAGRLARTRTFSALAGFIDQGESIEEAVRREVMEEAGIQVGSVSYHSSQPWPFPSSLMIGCHGQARSRDITIDPAEMTAAHWFHRGAVEKALAGDNPNLNLPGPIAIAHHLIRAWLAGEVRL